MSKLVPGYIPSGWTRGDPVQMKRAGAPFGVVTRADIAGAPSMDMVPTGTIFGVRFHVSEEPQVLAWLDWWMSEK